MAKNNRKAFRISGKSSEVRAKKHLGQHFLIDEKIAESIAATLEVTGYSHLLEIGPGMGVLTKYLLNGPAEVHVMEIDAESVGYLEEHYPELAGRIHQQDFLKSDLTRIFGASPFAVIGNFPYNISSQIVFKVLELREQIPEFSGMFQKEVALRICEKEGSRTYGILSVLVQAFYQAEYLFSVPPDVFNPPPKVDSGVLRLKRKEVLRLPCNERLFFRIVKMAFNQRRKTLRNSLKSLDLPGNLREDAIFDKRPEQLGHEAFIDLTLKIQPYAIPDQQ